MKVYNDIKFILLACATLGLAPFFPEPHIWGKLKWIWGGAAGMEGMDWFDVLLHGWPWLLLLRFGVVSLIKTFKNAKETVIQRTDQRR